METGPSFGEIIAQGTCNYEICCSRAPYSSAHDPDHLIELCQRSQLEASYGEHDPQSAMHKRQDHDETCKKRILRQAPQTLCKEALNDQANETIAIRLNLHAPC